MTPAAELRAAADRLRTLTTAAAHEDRTRWEVGHTLRSKSRVVVDEYLAAFASPVVALAVVDLLETEADVADDLLRRSPELTNEELAAWVHGPLAVARAILNTAPETR